MKSRENPLLFYIFKYGKQAAVKKIVKVNETPTSDKIWHSCLIYSDLFFTF